MKKILLSLSVLLTFAVTTGFANKPFNEDPGSRETFKKDFAGAQEISWSREENYDKVTFILGSRRAIAYFDETGKLVGCIRSILFEQLPLSVMRVIDKRFTNASVSEVRELTDPNGTAYRLTIEKGKKKYDVKVGPDGFISDVKRIR